MNAIRDVKIREKHLSQNEDTKRHNKLLRSIFFAFVVFASMSVKHGCEALDNNDEMPRGTNLLFSGNWDENKAVRIVTDICEGWVFDDAQGGYNIKRSVSFQRNNVRKRFFQISANSESCRFCPGLIGAVVFSEKNGIWEVELEQEHFARFGCHGVSPEAKLISIGSNRNALLFQWWRSGQRGGFVHCLSLIDLGDKDYPLLLQEQIYQTDDSPDPIIPKLEMRSSTKNEFYDIIIGSKLYRFENGKYKALCTQPGN